MLKNQVLELEESWREICMELERGKRELEEMVEEGEVRCKAIEEAKRCSFGFFYYFLLFSPPTL